MVGKFETKQSWNDRWELRSRWKLVDQLVQSFRAPFFSAELRPILGEMVEVVGANLEDVTDAQVSPGTLSLFNHGS